jgi:hypothetical protein
MPKLNFGKLKEWVLPLLLLIVSFTIISYVVTKNENNKKEETIEGLTIPQTVSTKNMSTEKVNLLLPSLKVYLLSKYPSRNSLTSDWNNAVSKKWEDLSGNKNDFTWDTDPFVNDKGFNTVNNVLTGPFSNVLKLPKTSKELTFMMRVSLIEKEDIDVENTDPINIGEIIANAKLSNQNKPDDMSINVSAPIKENFENIKENLVSGNQTPETIQNILLNASKIKEILDDHPNKGKKPKLNPVAFVFNKDNSNVLEIRVPNGVGNLEVKANGKSLTNIHKMSPADNTYYTLVYKELANTGHIIVYANKTVIIDEDVEFLNLSNSNMIFNPNGNLNVGLQDVGMLNRALNETEIGFFHNSGVFLRAILDNPSKVITDTFQVNFETDDAKCEETCTVNCTENKCSTDCVNKHKNACPNVYKDDSGNYIVRKLSYGNDRRVAREIYRINFPNCRNIPTILDDWYNKETPLPNTCPYVVDSQFNPCKYDKCENVDWNDPDPQMNKKCKNRIDAYCEEHAYLDPMCKCWRTEYKDLPECREFREKFNSAYDRGCKPEDFPIEANPDFPKYIRKDKIPCWGCTLDELPPHQYR